MRSPGWSEQREPSPALIRSPLGFLRDEEFEDESGAEVRTFAVGAEGTAHFLGGQRAAEETKAMTVGASQYANRSHRFLWLLGFVPANGVVHELAPGCQLELFADIGAMDLDSFDAEVETFRDLPRSLALPE
jgi:hypothetical protein